MEIINSINKITEIDIRLNELGRKKKDEKNKEEKDKIEKDIKNKKDEKNKVWEKITKDIPELIKGGSNQIFVDAADLLGKRFKEGGLTTSQIRNVFGEVKRIEMKIGKEIDIASLSMLQPKLAYAAARANKDGVDELKDILISGIKTVVEAYNKDNQNNNDLKKYFNNFADFFEAILAYHKSYGGK